MSLQLTDPQRIMLSRITPTSSRMARRLEGIQLLAEGYSVTEVADLLQVSRRSVQTWKQQLQQQGVYGLADRPHTGRPLSVDAQYIQCLETTLADYSLLTDGGWMPDTLRDYLYQQTSQWLSIGRLNALLGKLGYLRAYLVVEHRRQCVYEGNSWYKGERTHRGKRVIFCELNSG
jgi:transposase